MPDLAVADSSPIIVLARSGWIDLLRATAARIIVPQVVAAEISRRGPADEAVLALAGLSWIELAEAEPTDMRVRACGIDAGEAATLTRALRLSDTPVIIDDRAARRCARVLTIPHRGTIGVIAAAKLAGVIDVAEPAVADVRRAGLSITDAVVAQVLADLGE